MASLYNTLATETNNTILDLSASTGFHLFDIFYISSYTTIYRRKCYRLIQIGNIIKIFSNVGPDIHQSIYL